MGIYSMDGYGLLQFGKEKVICMIGLKSGLKTRLSRSQMVLGLPLGEVPAATGPFVPTLVRSHVTASTRKEVWGDFPGQCSPHTALPPGCQLLALSEIPVVPSTFSSVFLT